MAALGRCPLTTLKRYRDEEKLFEACERDFKFFVVKSGKVEIMDESGETPNTVTVHGPGEFTGDVAQSAPLYRSASSVRVCPSPHSSRN